MRWIAVVAVYLVASASAFADDWGAHRDPFDPGVVSRYKALLAHDPHDEAALRQLVAMYKQYRTVGKLEAEYEAQLAKADDWATLVILARMQTVRADTILWLKRALHVKPDDGLGWLALGDAETTDAAAARDAYQRAVKLITQPKQKRIALTKLVSSAQLVGDWRTADAGYADLIALAPKDGMLWLDRGNAQLGAKQFDAAKASFTTAESLLKTDPERQLSAMMNEGLALDGQGQPDQAITQYEHTLDKVPAGYYLAQELITRIVDIERKRHAVGIAITRLEQRWPEKRRGYFEWATLGDLYKETNDPDRAIEMYKHAVAKAPTEVVTQRKLIALLDKVSPAEALTQHEAAARVAPGDADLQIELAKRYWATQPDKAHKTLDALARRLPKNINVRSTMAALYEQWNEPTRAIVEYEALAAAEPKEPEHLIVLGEAYWRATENTDTVIDSEQPPVGLEVRATKALAAWDRLDKIGTADAYFRHGEVLAMHEMWQPAEAAYTKSLELDGTRAEVWYGRARAEDSLDHVEQAINDARRAVALTGVAEHADGLRNRELLVRVLGHAYTEGNHDALDTSLAKWRFAFERGDAASGYLLVAHHARIDSYQRHETLVQLYKLVPNDDTLGMAVSRSFVHRHDYDRAKHELEVIAKRSPSRAKDIAALIVQVDEERVRAEEELRLEEEGRATGSGGTDNGSDLVGRKHRFGMRLEVGEDVRNANGALLGIGWYRTSRLARGTALATRIEWTQRDEHMIEVNAFALASMISTRILNTRRFEVAVGLGPRFEVRYGPNGGGSTWDRGSIAGDLELEVLPRAIPATIGVRFDQTLTDDAKSAALLFELGFEVR